MIKPTTALPSRTEQPIIHVDATPDNDYPLRILRAYRANCDMRWAETTNPDGAVTNPMLVAMNEHQAQRAAILDNAILCLEDDADCYMYEPPFPPGSVVKSNSGLFVLATGHCPDHKNSFTGIVLYDIRGIQNTQSSNNWSLDCFELSSYEELVQAKSEPAE